MFQRHAHQFVALCLSAVVTVSVMAGVNAMAADPAAAHDAWVKAPASQPRA